MVGSRNHCCYSDEERRRNRGPCAYDTRGKSERVVLGPLLMISRTIQVWSPPARSEGSCWPQELAFLLVAQVHEAVMPRSPGSRPAKPHAQCFLPSNDFKASQDGSPFCPWSLETVTPGSDPGRTGGIRARLRQSRLLKNVPLAMVLKFVFLS